MNKYVKRLLEITFFIAAFSTIFLYLNSLFLLQWDNRDNGIERMETLLSFPEQTSDVLFLGSSGVYAGISPTRIWEKNKISSYNLSTSEHNFFARYFKLKQILETRKVNLVVLDVSYLFNLVTSAELERYQLNYKQGFHSMRSIDNKLEYLTTLKSEFNNINPVHYVFPILKHHSNWDYFSSKKLESEVDSFKLGSLLSKNVKKIKHKEYVSEKQINETELKYFKKILELCQKEDVSVLAIITPKADNNISVEQNVNILSQEHGFNFINFANSKYTKELGLNYDQDFYNAGHLNILGNRKLSDYLGDYIAENYPNVKIWHESEKDYAEKTKIWQEALLEYTKFYENLSKEIASKS